MQESAAEAEDEGVMSELGGRERGTKDRREVGEEGRTQTKLEMVVELIQTEFREGELAEEAACQAVALIWKGGGRLLRHRPCVGDLEGGGGDSQSPLYHRHHLPRLPSRIPGGLRYRDRHP